MAAAPVNTEEPSTTGSPTARKELTATAARGRATGIHYAYEWPLLTATPTAAPTGADGKVTYSIQPNSSFPLKNGHNVQFVVKAYRKGDPTLAGISGTRLVQVATAR